MTASIISLVNDARIAAGKSSLGWLNPWIYSTAHKAFTDVVGGETASCGTDGFPVTKGWDPSTGFGTPVSFDFFSYFVCIFKCAVTDFELQIFPELVKLALEK